MLPRATAATRGRLAKLAALALLALGLLPAFAHGAAAPALIFQNGGATLPGSVIRTPDGGLWITDPSGVCKLTVAPAAPSLVASPFCAAVAHQGPNKPDKMAFDPATNNFYVSDVGTEVPPVPGGIWRLHWNPLTGSIDTPVQIVVSPLGNPAQGVSFATPAGVPVLDFSDKRDTFIFRITNPDLCPQAPSATQCPTNVIVGATSVSGATTIAHVLGGTTLYAIEDVGVLAPFPVVTRIDGLSAATPAGGQVVGGLPAGTPNALAADPGGGGRPNVVYVGTSNVNATPGSDEVWAINAATQASQVYVPPSFAGVTGLGVDTSPAATGGDLFVADDVFAASGSPAPGGGRVWQVALVGKPTATITQSPPAVTNNRTATFAFTKSDPAKPYFCSLDGGAPVRCDDPAGTGGSAVYGPLPDGAHRFELRSLAPTELPFARVGFTVDTVGPNVALAGVKVAGTSATITFAADELNALTGCSLDGAPAARCDSPFVVSGLPVGAHSVTVSATDPAGNTGRPALAGFAIAPAATPPVSKPRARRKAVASIAGNGRMTVAFQAAADAKVARIVLSGLRVTGKASKSVARLVLPVRGLKPGKWNVVHRRLTAAQLRALRAGTRVAISVRAGQSAARLLVTDKLTIRIPAPPAGGPDAVPKRKPVKR